ncbi:unnamed protein product [Orchesella dallaii]|uniref:Uncharacterized protein n=1 Tax=Orchesella dallaii TaxID=48710 RepID=A0ABP1PU59_9HEXA
MAYRLFLLIFLFGLLKAEQKQPYLYNISRDNVGVWLNPPLQHDALTNKQNLNEVIKRIGSTFGTILWSQPSKMAIVGSGYDMLNDSLQMFPIMAASYNKFVSALNNTTFSNITLTNKTTGDSNTSKTVNVIMSFDVLPVPIHDDLKFHQYMELHHLIDENMTIDTLNTKSLDGAKFLADYTNKLYNGTVDTLLLIDKDYLRRNYQYEAEDIETRLEETLYSVKWARNVLTNQLGARDYKLGVLLSYRFFVDDTINLQTTYIKNETLMNVDVIVVATMHDDQFDDHWVELENIVKIIEASDSMLRNLKLNATIIPLIFCNRRSPFFQYDHIDYDFFNCWQYMNDWAVRNNRKIIMYEAIDHLGGRF